MGAKLQLFGALTALVSGFPLINQFPNQSAEEEPPITFQAVQWQQSSLFDVPVMADDTIAKVQEQYLNRLNSQGITKGNQGIWLQSEWGEFASHQGTQPRSAASLTKVATTMAVLEEFDPNYRFTTEIYGTGPVVDGILQGDMVVMGEGNPMMVWEEGFAVANAIEELGIGEVTGDLVVVGKLFMNFNQDGQASGELLQQSFDRGNWPPAAARAYESVKSNFTPPQLGIRGQVKLSDRLPLDSRLLVSHKSLKLQEIIRLMNIYSNNKISEMLASLVGGGAAVGQRAAILAQVPEAEIRLINGSGLGVDNRISPRAACAMFLALEEQIKPFKLTVGDLFPVGGKDISIGTMKDRKIPQGMAIKTGTLNQVSALAGLIPDRDRGSVCFALINGGSWKIPYLRQQQDVFLQTLSQDWALHKDFLEYAPIEQLGDRDRITTF